MPSIFEEVAAKMRKAHRGRSTKGARYLQQTGITAKEIEVVQALANGIAIEQIARDLDRSRSTVLNHLDSVLKKTGARTRYQYVAWLAQRKVITVNNIGEK